MKRIRFIFIILMIINLGILATVFQAQAQSICVCDGMKQYAGTTNDASSVLQQCINNAADNQIVEIPAGKYYISHQILITSKSIAIRTQGKNETMQKCSYMQNHDCAELVATSSLNEREGVVLIKNANNVVIDHLVINGNKSQRENSNAGAECKRGNNVYGYNIVATDAANFTITNSVSKKALCASGLLVCQGGTPITRANTRVLNNTFVSNGVHNKEGLWADGVTAADCINSTFANNEFIDNTDIDMIFGGCQNCIVQNNIFSHTAYFEGGSFAALMIHAWPHTSGNYTGSIFSNNSIYCSVKKRCGFGLYIGSDSWYKSFPYGGSFHSNKISYAQQGVNIDDAHDIEVYNNPVINSGGSSQTSCGQRTGGLYNMGLRSFSINTSKDSPPVNYTRIDWDGCIPNWWNVQPDNTPVNDAQFISQSVPSTMNAGQAYQVSIIMRNTGTNTWTKSNLYRLGSQDPQAKLSWGFCRVDLASDESIAPAQQKTFSFTVTAPSTPGIYNFQWRMLKETVEWFGESTQNLAVNVQAKDTPPTTPIITDEGSTTTKRDQLYASWTSSDPESGIAEYQYRITQGSTSGTAIRDWTSVGTAQYVTAGGLSLTSGSTYYFAVKAKNGAGLYSSIGYSDGITVVPIIDVTLTSNNTTVKRGQTLTYRITLTNNTAQSQTFYAAIQFWKGDNTVKYMDNRYGPITFGPNETRTYNLSLAIPLSAPLQEYIVKAIVGTSTINIYDRDEFRFTVIQ